ncbi:B3 domain-containing transcription factor VRN1-like [Hibiscus syriacus]|nr:B3 domain-containing transcription factor VRN1-like [Hibiscus syriacus]
MFVYLFDDVSGNNFNLEISSSSTSPHESKPSKINGNLKKVEKSSGKLDVTAERSVKTETFSCLQHLTATEKAYAAQIASSWKSTGNPVFIVVMIPSSLSNRYRMGIPSDFAWEYLTMLKCNLTLSNSAEKIWPVKYRRNAGNTILQAEFYGGWHAFAEDNHLGVGDISVFELIKQPEILMKGLQPQITSFPVATKQRTARLWPLKTPP